MTRAVCFGCGAIKFGAFVPCDSCGVQASNDDELIISLALSDHYIPESAMTEIGREIASGKRPVLDQETMDEFRKEIDRFRNLDPTGIFKEVFSGKK